MSIAYPPDCLPESSLCAPSLGWRVRAISTLRSLICVAAAGVALAGCFPVPASVSAAVEGPVPDERGEECRVACGSLGMELTSVVLIMNHAGCVCQIIPAPIPASPEGPSSQDKGAAAAAGGAAVAAVIAAQEAEAARRRQSSDDGDRRRRQQDDSWRQQQQQQQQHWQTPAPTHR
jgi:hypothetical protein